MSRMEEVTRSVTWEALEHHHIEKGSDWFWALGIITLCATITAFFFGNFLFAILIMLSGSTMALFAGRAPQLIAFSVSTRGIRVGDNIYPYTTLDAYCIDEESQPEPQLLIRSKRMHMPMIILPIPPEYIHDIEDLLFERLSEEEMEEPFGSKVLEFFGL